MGIESKCIGIFKISKEELEDKTLIRKEAKGRVKDIKNYPFFDYYVHIMDTSAVISKKKFSGMILNIESKSDNWNIQFPVRGTPELKQELLNKKVRWNKKVEYLKTNDNCEIIALYELYILSGNYKDKKYEKEIIQNSKYEQIKIYPCI